MPENTPASDSFPLLIGKQVEAYGLMVRRQTCTELAAMLRSDGQALAANLVEEDRDFTELSRSMTVIPQASAPEHKAGCRVFGCRCGCDRAQDCQDCQRCVCWRSDCCAQRAVDAARREERTKALRRLLDGVGLAMLTELRETAAAAEEAALRHAVARRMRHLVPGGGRHYVSAVFEARDSKLCMGHADYSDQDVELYARGQDDPNETVDLNDEALSRSLGAFAELLRPDEGARLTVGLDLTGDDG
ncbi:hypothetical protein ACLQ16_03845 [Streptomyces albidoflavus]|uniref:hypothetical protein n=1 Tax=Streptomyces albidoflavus TaxID=1886 RepID=UPI000A1C8D68|nr:hypothetical protein [Streptomyces albidoflavus]